jgi:hypothetical protein
LGVAGRLMAPMQQPGGVTSTGRLSRQVLMSQWAALTDTHNNTSWQQQQQLAASLTTASERELDI